MDLLFHILLKRWILQDLDILKTRKLVKEDLFSKALFIPAAVSPVPSSRHPYGISSINQFLSFLLFCYRCLRVILCLYCPYCSHTLPQQQYSKILQQRTHQPHSQLNLWHTESFSRFRKCVWQPYVFPLLITFLIGSCCMFYSGALVTHISVNHLFCK